MTTEYPDVHPHGELREVFEDVFLVTGSVFVKPGLRISRNMIVLRENDELSLISSVRLNEDGLAALDKLGTVRHVVKLGAFHGMDDRFYVDRYQAEMWAVEGMEHADALATTRVLEPGGPLPISRASLFVFETSAKPEAALLLERDGGILLTCDSLQNWASTDEFFNEEGAAKLTAWGFVRPANPGPGWLAACSPKASDFERLLRLEFAHLVPSHGTPLRERAKGAFSESLKPLLSK